MQNDIEENEPAAAKLLAAVTSPETATPTCLFCGENAPELVCPECEAKNADANRELDAKRDRQVLAARIDAFREKVGNYADTDPALLPATAAYRAATSYNPGGRFGLTIIGPGSTGKTRSSVWVASRELEIGTWVEYRQCGELRQEIISFSRNGIQAQSFGPLSKCGLLVLDDFGNHEFTRTTEEFFLSLLERRTNHGRRTIVTTQYSAGEIKNLMTTHQMADAILRRIGKQYAIVANTKTDTIEHPF